MNMTRTMNLTRSKRHVDYCMHQVNLLWHYGIKPILVFDGGHLLMKNEQENVSKVLNPCYVVLGSWCDDGDGLNMYRMGLFRARYYFYVKPRKTGKNLERVTLVQSPKVCMILLKRNKHTILESVLGLRLITRTKNLVKKNSTIFLISLRRSLLLAIGTFGNEEIQDGNDA